MLIIIGIIIIVFLLVIIYLPRQQAKKLKDSSLEKKIEFENESRKIIIQLLGGIAFFSTFYFSYQTYLLTNEQQVTNRFTETIKLLSNENKEIRIGALYALERLCKDSKKDKESILQIVNAYVRSRTQSMPQHELHNYIDTFDYHNKVDNVGRWIVDYSCHYDSLPERFNKFFSDTIKSQLDIQVAINILGTNNLGLIHLNFKYLDLRSIDFVGLNLSNSDFSFSNLTSDTFDGSLIDSCNFSYVFAQGAEFHECKVRKSKFIRSFLQRADFWRADLSNSLIGYKTCCRNAGFEQADFSNCKFEDGIDFKSADLSYAHLANIIFKSVNMENVDLTETKLNGAYLKKTIGLSKSQIDKAIIDKFTILP